MATARLYARATADTRYAAFTGRQRDWVLGTNPWGTNFMIGAGEVYPHCPEHQLANLGGSHDGRGAILRGAVFNGPNAAPKLEELNGFPTMKKCTAAPPKGAWTDFDGKGRAVRGRRGRLADRRALAGLHHDGAAGLRADRTGRRRVAAPFGRRQSAARPE